MAQMLSKTDSPAKVARAVRRHIRLAKRTGHPKAIELALRIDAPAAAQKTAVSAANEAADAVEDAFDDWSKADAALDRLVKRAHRRCADFDADNTGAGTAALVFAGVPPSVVTETRREEEPDIVAKLVARGQKLPEGHLAIPLLPELTAAADASRAAERPGSMRISAPRPRKARSTWLAWVLWRNTATTSSISGGRPGRMWPTHASRRFAVRRGAWRTTTKPRIRLRGPDRTHGCDRRPGFAALRLPVAARGPGSGSRGASLARPGAGAARP
ncbi:MAG: hypothetical protein HY908_15670 [Myxococcales bacterium]|nr:hypothetical protein [Myxococcales bacterium]